MKIAWILGWAIPEDWFSGHVTQVFPAASNWYFSPASDILSRVTTTDSFDWIVGYSLGALRLLADRFKVMPGPRIALLAPCFAFSKDEDLGGRVSKTQLRYLSRWLRRDPKGALEDFYKRAALDIVANPSAFDLNLLQEGLSFLEHSRIAPPSPNGWLAFCGSEDPLLDSKRMSTLDPTVQPVAGATHHPRTLLPALAAQL